MVARVIQGAKTQPSKANRSIKKPKLINAIFVCNESDISPQNFETQNSQNIIINGQKRTFKCVINRTKTAAISCIFTKLTINGNWTNINQINKNLVDSSDISMSDLLNDSNYYKLSVPLEFFDAIVRLQLENSDPIINVLTNDDQEEVHIARLKPTFNLKNGEPFLCTATHLLVLATSSGAVKDTVSGSKSLCTMDYSRADNPVLTTDPVECNVCEFGTAAELEPEQNYTHQHVDSLNNEVTGVVQDRYYLIGLETGNPYLNLSKFKHVSCVYVFKSKHSTIKASFNKIIGVVIRGSGYNTVAFILDNAEVNG